MTALQHMLLVASAALLSMAVGQPYELVFSGSCDAKHFLDGLTFRRMGVTAIGAPWYKAVGQEQYMYYDLDCSGRLDGTPRWIIDGDKPNVNAVSDLDGDKVCAYHARINSRDTKSPPLVGDWSMECSTGWRTQFVIMLGKTSTTSTRTTYTSTTTTTETTFTSTSTAATTTTGSTTTQTVTRTTTEAPTTSTRAPSTTVAATTTTAPASPVAPGGAAPGSERGTDAPVHHSTAPPEPMIVVPQPSDPEETEPSDPETLDPETLQPSSPLPMSAGAPQMLALSGACAFKGYLNGLTYELQGHTADGAPYYRASGTEEYIYHDVDCDGRGSAPRWILDGDRPYSQGHTGDLDADGRCDYHARVDSSMCSRKRPPYLASWRMFCGAEGWQDVTVTLREVDAIQPMTTVAPHSTQALKRTSYPAMFLSGAAGPRGLLAVLAVPLLGLMAR